MELGRILCMILVGIGIFGISIFSFVYILGVVKDNNKFASSCEAQMKNNLMISYLLFNDSSNQNNQLNNKKNNNSFDFNEKYYDFGNWNEEE